MPWATNISYKNESIQKYNEIIKSVCKENNVYFVEIFDQMMKLSYKKLLEDGLHPNSDGHQKIFEIIKDFLIKNKII
ncbi:MAG: SGNH/GDSL hydrolase family protein [Methanosarcinales archaeon]